MWKEAYINSIIKETDLTWKFVITPKEKFNFMPGQFVQIKIKDIVRSYSIASYYPNENLFELLIVKLDGGIMTKYLFEEVKEGDAIQIKGPLGKFILPEKIESDILFICTGTGLAPFRSMLQSILYKKISHQKIYLIFGTRTVKDLLCHNEMKKYEEIIDDFKYIPTLSREEWNGEKGYVHSKYIKLINEKNLNNPFFYLCGWRDMIKEARINLKELGFDSKSIKLEIYG